MTINNCEKSDAPLACVYLKNHPYGKSLIICSTESKAKEA